MSHRQGIITTAGLIGGVSRSSARGVLSAHEAALHDEDCARTAPVKRASLLSRLRRLSTSVKGARACGCSR